jgi:hypothetical protein
MNSLTDFSKTDELAVSPLVSAVVAWLLVTRGDLTSAKMDTMISLHFPARSSADYATRFLNYQPNETPARKGHNIGAVRLVEEATLEAGALLRKLVVATTPTGEFSDDLAFESNPVFRKGEALIEQFSSTLGPLTDFDLKRCPRCKLVGEVSLWFGWRTIDGKKIAQSWCQLCRSA